MAVDKKTVPLKAPPKNPHNVEATKFYIFNETGNIMMASTDNSGTPLSQSVQDVFSEVSVFFAGMSRAITTTINPDTNKNYSLYNYTALERVISGSGLFVHVTEEDVTYKTSEFGANFSKNLLEALLGLATGAGALGFASAMMASIGKEGLNLSTSSSTSESKVANIVFVCEYLLGMPMVSAIVIYADAKTHKQQIKLGPCFSESSVTTSWEMHKDTYMFVTPKFIRHYAGDLDSINTSAEYLAMIDWFSGLLTQRPTVFEVVDSTNTAVTGELTVGQAYTIQGQFFGTTEGTLQFVGQPSGVTVTASSWNTDSIKFSVNAALATAALIEILDSAGHKIAATEGFTVVA
jgi:hypothetical protein